jgi:hypothetical protein
MNSNLQNSLANSKLELPKSEKSEQHISQGVGMLHGDEKRIRTTLDLPQSLHKKLKVKCAMEGLSLREFFEQLARKSVDRHL